MATWGEYKADPKLFIIDLMSACKNMSIKPCDGGMEITKHNLCECFKPELGVSCSDRMVVRCNKCGSWVTAKRVIEEGLT